MSNAFKRTDRVAEMIQRELAQIIQQEIQAPHLPGLVTIAGVKITKDLAHAKVYFTVFNGDPAEVESILNEVSSYIRTLLAKKVVLRIMPELHFVHDKSLDYANRLSRLIARVNPPSDDDEQR